jgi:hypothetical protein
MHKTAPQVIHRKVHLRHRSRRGAPAAEGNAPPVPVVRQHPGRGFRHVLHASQVRAFLAILPDWDVLSRGLDNIVLAPGSDVRDGWHQPGVVAVCAWPRALWRTDCDRYFVQHSDLFARLGVPVEQTEEGWLARFTESTARAYQLLHVLLHELGHHHDRMTTRRRVRTGRGEGYAERYALDYSERIWERYFKTFGWD